MISTIFSWLDVRGTLRRLRASPWFTLLTVVVLAGGLGVSIFTWSFLHTALALAVSGTYGLMARSVSRRIREIRIRALGASDRSVMGMLLGQGARHLGSGALVALPLNLLAAAGFSYFFPIAYGVSAGIALLVSASITAIVLAASWRPARHALQVEPRQALGSE